MANNCYNTILFQGDRVAECIEFIKSRMPKELSRYDGIYLIDGEQEKYCFDLTIENNIIDFITEGSPDIYQIDQLALKFGLDYRYDYVEVDGKIFGCVIADSGGMSRFDLNDSHFDQIDYDEENDVYWIKDYDKENDVYSFRGKEYESQYDILDILLEEEIKKV